MVGQKDYDDVMHEAYKLFGAWWLMWYSIGYLINEQYQSIVKNYKQSK